jgi:hypothetical protein
MKFFILVSLFFSCYSNAYSLAGDCLITRDKFPDIVEKFYLKLINPEIHYGFIAAGSSSFGDNVDIQMVNHNGNRSAQITINGVNNSGNAFSVLPFDASGVVRFMMGTTLNPTVDAHKNRTETQQLSCELTISK